MIGWFFRRNSFLFFIVFLYTWFLFAFNTNNGDYTAYENFYYTRAYSEWGGEVLFGALVDLSKAIGLDFFQFKVFVATATLVLLYRFFIFFDDVKVLLASIFLFFSFL